MSDALEYEAVIGETIDEAIRSVVPLIDASHREDCDSDHDGSPVLVNWIMVCEIVDGSHSYLEHIATDMTPWAAAGMLREILDG